MRRRRVAVVAATAAWTIAAASIAAAVAFDQRLRAAGRDDLVRFTPATLVLVCAILSALLVGTGLVVRRPDHPAGWLFLGLGTSISIAGPIDGFAAYGAVSRAEPMAWAQFAAHLGDVTFVPWFVLIALVLHVTPTGRPLSRTWSVVAVVTVVSGAVTMLSGIFGDRQLEAPFEDVPNPIAAEALDGALAIVGGIAMLVVGVGLIAAAVSLVVRYRRAVGSERRQLQWLYLVAATLPLFVPAAFAAAWTGRQAPLLVATGGFIVAVPVATGLAVSRFHLYDVDRILSNALTYSLSSAVLIATYAVVVVAAGRALSAVGDSSAIAAVTATLVVVTIAAPVRSNLQDWLDRRFNRRRFEAVRYVSDSLRQGSAMRIDEVLARAVGDQSLSVAFWSGERRQWSNADGVVTVPAVDSVEVDRDGVPIARISFDSTVAEPHTVLAAAKVASAELDNARLRAAISSQLVEVQESRARIAAAQSAERRKIERNLHDGAQQRLLALAMNLRAAHLNGGDSRLRDAVGDGIDGLMETVAELRNLANGLHPVVLNDGGLAGALDDLAGRSPIPIDVDAVDVRLDPDVEACAWFVVCEAVANVHKHADAGRIAVRVQHDGAWLDLHVVDDGCGGADPAGSGLVGLADRVASIGGSITISDVAGGGTDVHVRVPCGS